MARHEGNRENGTTNPEIDISLPGRIILWWQTAESHISVCVGTAKKNLESPNCLLNFNAFLSCLTFQSILTLLTVFI